MASSQPSIEDAARLYAARDLDATERCCRAILALDPRQFDAMHLLSVVCIQTGRHAEAVDLLQHARPGLAGNAQLLFNLGNAWQGLEDHQRAVEAYDAALALNPNDPGVLNNRGTSLRNLGGLDTAIQCFQALLARHPAHAPGHHNLAVTLAKADRLEEAETHFRLSLHYAPLDTPPDRLADVAGGLGAVLLGLGRPLDAIALCRDLLLRHPGLKVLEWNLSLALLLIGDYPNGWPAYEARWHVAGHDTPHPDARVLDLEHVAGRRVLVTGEQGRGDTIQFARYASLLAARGAVVSLQVYPDLVDLLATLPGVACVADEPPYDLRTSLLSLPLAFGTTLASVPAPVAYLSAPPDRVARWRDCLGIAQRPRIGIAWSGSPNSRERSAMPLQALEPLLRLPGFEFHVLQKELTPDEHAWLATHRLAEPHDAALADFADTAALIMQMDLVVSIDTAIAHLAGALGRPVWVTLPFNPDWRWLLNRTDSPWYPTARLFRQPRRGDWAGVVGQIVAALTEGGPPVQKLKAIPTHLARTP